MGGAPLPFLFDANKGHDLVVADWVPVLVGDLSGITLCRIELDSRRLRKITDHRGANKLVVRRVCDRPDSRCFRVDSEASVFVRLFSDFIVGFTIDRLDVHN